MQAFVSSTRNEIDKLLARKSVKVYFILAIFMPVLIGLGAIKIQSNGMVTLPALSVSLFIMKSFMMVILPLFIFMASSELFAGEWDKGLLFQVRPVSRAETYSSKVASITMLAFSQLMIVWGSALVTTAVLEKNVIWSELSATLISAILSILPLVALVSFAAFIAQWFKSGPAALATSVFLYGMMATVPFGFPELMYLFPTAYIDWYQQWLGNVNVLWIVQSFTYMFSFSSLFLAAGYYMFRTKEL